MAIEYGEITRQDHADSNAEWRVSRLTAEEGGDRIAGRYALVAVHTPKRLVIRNTRLAVEDEFLPPRNAVLEFVPLPSARCREFPEADLNATVLPAFTATRNSQEPVYGFADVHVHLAFPKAFGQAGMSGDLFHPYGIMEALRDCWDLHGRDGELDVLEGETAGKGVGGHSVLGYPSFTYWPHRATNTHVQGYYRWLQRTYLSGLRLLVTDATGDRTFCQVLSLLHPIASQGDCRSDADVAMQTRYVYDLQDYIDAQEGGPQQGWFRIVGSAKEAREVIRQNKLAVVLGSEYGTLFDCSESASFCTDEYVDRKLDELYDMGIRSVFPVHRTDNAFGGTMPQGGTQGSWMQLSGRMSTSEVGHLSDLMNPTKLLFRPIGGHYWDLASCPEGVKGISDIRSMRRFVAEDLSGLGKSVRATPVLGALAAELLDWTFIDKLKPLPEYQGLTDGGHACNTRSLQPLTCHGGAGPDALASLRTADRSGLSRGFPPKPP